MTDEEKKRVLQLIFSEMRADHTEDGLTIEFRPNFSRRRNSELVAGQG
jgi:hypothetical protein